MSGAQDTTLIVLTGVSVDVRVASALQSAAEALGYADGCAIVRLSDVDDLRRFAFDLDARDFAGDVPASVTGYNLVAVPAFADCLDDMEAKRIAWMRMKAAVHPGNPLD